MRMAMLISGYKKPLNPVIKFCSTGYSQAYALPTQGLINWPWDDIIHPAVGIKLSYIHKGITEPQISPPAAEKEKLLFPSTVQVLSSGSQKPLPKAPISKMMLTRPPQGREVMRSTGRSLVLLSTFLYSHKPAPSLLAWHWAVFLGFAWGTWQGSNPCWTSDRRLCLRKSLYLDWWMQAAERVFQQPRGRGISHCCLGA